MLVEAFTKVPIVQRLPEQITAIDSANNILMLGTRQGNVSIYSVTPNETDSREMKVKVVHVIKLRKPIVQLRLLPKLNCVLVLCDHVINVYDLRTYQLKDTLGGTRGAVAFEVDQSLLSSGATSVDSDAVWVDSAGNEMKQAEEEEDEHALLRTRLAVSTKRRVLVFETYSNWSQLKETHNLMIPDARVLLFFGQIMYLANKSEYIAVQLPSCEIFDLFHVGTGEPGIFLLASDTVGFLQDQKMALVSPRTNQRMKANDYSRVVAKINWSETPTAVLSVSWPYLIALLPSCIEVRVRESRQLVQQEMFDRPKLLSPQVPSSSVLARRESISANAMSRQIGAGGLRRPMKNFRATSVTGPQPPPNTLEANPVYVASSDHVWRLVGVDRVRQVQLLMDRKEYDLAWHLSGTVPAPEALERVLPIREIGVLHAFTLFSREHRFDEAFSIFGDLKVDPSHVVGMLRGGLLPDEYQSKIRYPSELPKLNEEQSKKAMRALTHYLLSERNIMLSSDAPLADVYHPIMPDSISLVTKQHHLRQVIDTSLFKCYLFTKQDTLLESFLRLPDNACHFEETEHTLKMQQRYNDLLVLYESRGDHRRALKFLLAQSQKAGSLLFGPLPTVRYLQKLGPKHWEVICEFSKWVLDRHPEDGLRIFTDYASEPLSRRRVYEFLHDTVPRDPSQRLVISYLEHVTGLPEEEADMNHEERVWFNNRLGDELIMQAKATAEESVRGLPESQQAFHMVDTREVQAVRSRLQDFLDNSTLYQPRKLLLNYPVDCYFEERALLYARMGRLRDALALWLHVLEQPDRAECVAKSAYESGACPEAFLHLMEVCLVPPTAAQLEIVIPASSATSTPEAEVSTSTTSFHMCLDHGLKMLDRYGSKIDAAKAVALLPESVPLSAVLPYLKTALEAKDRRRRHQELQRQLCYTELLKRQESRMDNRAQKIELSEETKCSVCHKRLGATSAFGRYPDGRLAHYGCCQELRV